MAENRKNEEEREGKWVGPGITIGRFGNKYALVHFRGSYFEVDLEDMRSANSVFGSIGCDGALILHVPHTKFPIHYLVGSQTLVFVTKMRNEYLNGNQTTWNNTDTRVKPSTFTNKIYIVELLFARWEGERDLMISLSIWQM